MSDTPNIRVRLAPSPTGEVHIGTIWIALFNWLFAKQRRGTFVLRVEDTDRSRFVEGAVERIYEALDWLGLTPDEGPNQGGNFGPYVQSQRLELYQRYAAQLVEQGRGYHCFCTLQRLEQVRTAQQAAKQPTKYDGHCAELDSATVAARLKAGESSVIRLRMPKTGGLKHTDIIRGRVEFRYDLQDDSVLLKSDGYPTYHLAVVVDDHLMDISHVIRAEEWLPSIPKHLYLYESFGWQPPQFAHLPLILGSDRSKLSKRHGATSALWFRDQGYLPEAIRNFLALMGWHPKGDNEVLSDHDILQQFKLEAINPSGAIFDLQKLDWLNGHYLRRLPSPELVRRLQPFWTLLQAEPIDPDQQLRFLELVKDRLHRLSEINELTATLFPKRWDAAAQTFDRNMLKPKKASSDPMESLRWARGWLKRQEVNAADRLKASGLAAIAEAGKKNGDILWPLRVALSLRAQSPDVFDLIAALGKKEALRRVDFFLAD